MSVDSASFKATIKRVRTHYENTAHMCKYTKYVYIIVEAGGCAIETILYLLYIFYKCNFNNLNMNYICSHLHVDTVLYYMIPMCIIIKLFKLN